MPEVTLKPQAEVLKEIEALKEIKPKVLRRSMFGDDHHAAIDAQVEVLETFNQRGLTFARHKAEGYFDDQENVRDAALDALAWVTGQKRPDSETGTLAGDWKELVR